MTLRSSTVPILPALLFLLAARHSPAAPGDGGGGTTAPPPIPWTSSPVPDGNLDRGMYASMATTTAWCTGNGFAWLGHWLPSRNSDTTLSWSS